MNLWVYNAFADEESASRKPATVPLIPADELNHSIEDLSLNTSKHTTWFRRSVDLYRRISPVALPFVLISTLLILFLRYPSRHSENYAPYYSRIAGSDDYDPGAPFAPLNIQKLWGTNAPYFSVDKYKQPPRDCRLTQVNILHRHGSRFPSHSERKQFKRAIHKLKAAKAYSDRKLRFLKKYKYEINGKGMAPYGEFELFESGRKTFSRYANLTSGNNLPFIRVVGNEGTIHSAFKWAEGFGSSNTGIPQPSLGVASTAEKGYNNTLHPTNCPNIRGSKSHTHQWRHIYAGPIAESLNSKAKKLPHKLKSTDVQHLMELCALETLANEKYSPVCDLFTEEDFEGFEYALDLDRYYTAGYGAELGPVQGVGYINELLARLTDQPVRDNTQINQTLDSNPATFPLGRGIYADFTHSGLMASVISTMGLFHDKAAGLSQGAEAMDAKRPNKDRAWFISKITPFSARMVVERMECGLRSTGKYGGKLESERRESRKSWVYVRVLVNDAVQVDICGGENENGLCLLEKFVKSQEYAREGWKGDWAKCFL